jgi:hypothetical protein
MSDDGARQTNIVGPVDAGWTVVTLKEYLDRMLEDRQRQHTHRGVYYDKMFDQAEAQNILIRSHYDSLLIEYDRRYQARFTASEQAVKDAFAAQEKAINAALAAASAAVNKADIANEKRFDNVNEFRAQLGDQQRTFMPRAEVETMIKSLGEKLESVVARIDRSESRGQGSQQTWGYIVAAAGVLIGVAGIILAVIR